MQSMNPDDELSSIKMFTAAQAANLLGISEQTMYSIINNGEISFTHVRKRIMISRQQLLEYVKSHSTQSKNR